MSAQLTVVPLRQEKQRGPVGVVGRAGSLTRVEASDGDLEAAAVRCTARHFGLQDADVRNVLTNEPGSGWQAVLAHAGVHSTQGRGVHIVCVLVLRDNVIDWVIAGQRRHEVEWLPRTHRWSSPDDDRAVALALEAIRELLRRTTIATVLVGPVFSVPELRRIYDDLWDTSMDAPNFQRRFTAASAGLLRPMRDVEVATAQEAHELEGEVVTRTRRSESRQILAHPAPTDEEPNETQKRGLGRPPQLWIAGDETKLEPPLMVPPNAGWKPGPLGPWQFEDIQAGAR